MKPLSTLKLIPKNWHLSTYSWLIIFFGAFLNISLSVFVWQQINNDYERTLAEVSRETMNLARTCEEHVRNVVFNADKDSANFETSL